MDASSTWNPLCCALATIGATVIVTAVMINPMNPWICRFIATSVASFHTGCESFANEYIRRRVYPRLPSLDKHLCWGMPVLAEELKSLTLFRVGLRGES